MKLMNLALIGLVVAVVAVILFAKGGDNTTPTLQITPGTDMMEIPTDISCSNAQECINYILEQDPTAENPQATCEGTCTFITEKTPIAEEEDTQ